MERQKRGRQKISMEKMQNESHLQVTFSKRRYGLFKKVSEICILCGVEAAIIVFSPGQKVYSFGHPSVDAIVNKYINSITNVNPLLENQAVGVQHNANNNQVELNMGLTYMENLLDVENDRAQILKNKKNVDPYSQNWWANANNIELNLQQLECLKNMMENLQSAVGYEQRKIILEAQNRVNMAYQASPIDLFDAQTNVLFAQSPNPNVTNNGGDGASGTNPWPYNYHPGFF